MNKKPFISDIMSESKQSTSYYNLRIAEWKMQLIIEVLEEKLNSFPEDLGDIVSKSNLKHVIEELKLPF